MALRCKLAALLSAAFTFTATTAIQLSTFRNQPPNAVVEAESEVAHAVANPGRTTDKIVGSGEIEDATYGSKAGEARGRTFAAVAGAVNLRAFARATSTNATGKRLADAQKEYGGGNATKGPMPAIAKLAGGVVPLTAVQHALRVPANASLVKCIAHHREDAETPACCGQASQTPDMALTSEYICPQEAPICTGFIHNLKSGTCSNVPQRFQGRKANGRNALIVGLAHNIAGTLRNTIEYVEGIGAMFANYAVVIQENDSTDNTKKLLMKWAQRNDNVNVDMGIFHMQRRASNRHMGHLRNRALELAWDVAMRKTWEADVVIVIDFDIQAVDLLGLDHATGLVLDDGYVGVAANGAWSDGRYYDIFALRNCEVKWDARKGVMWKEDWNYTKSFWRVIPSSVPPFPVDSAFSGAAIYRASAVFGSSGTLPEIFRARPMWNNGDSVAAADTPPQYGESANEQYHPSAAIGEGHFPCSYGSGGVEDCEHIPFSVCLNARAKAMGLKPLHVVPSWGLSYGVRLSDHFRPLQDTAVFESSSPIEVRVPSSDANHEQDPHWLHGPVRCGAINPSLPSA